MFDQKTTVLVNEDTIYQRRDHSLGLMFWRAGLPTPTRQPAFFLQSPRPSPTLFEDRFVSVYPVLEYFSQVATPAPAPPMVYRFKPAFYVPDAEPEFLRTNNQVLFQINRPYGVTIQTTGFVVEFPDLCDDPWTEWVHPPASPEAALFPFRQIPSSFRGQQFNLYYGQPQPWKIEAEVDIDRPFRPSLLHFRQVTAIPQPITTCGRLDVYDYGNGSVLLAWGPFIGGIPDSYNVYVNGVLNQSIGNPFFRLAVIEGLFGASYNGQVVTPATTYQLKVVAVSAGEEVSESDTLITAQPTSVGLTTPMKRIFPFPNTGNN